MSENNHIINVGIVEDDKVIQNNLIRFLELSDDIKVGIHAFSVETYLSKYDLQINLNTDVLLLDIGLPGMSGLEGIPHIIEKNPAVNIIILTTFEEESMILEAMCAGAVAYISKKTSLKQIVEAIRIVAAGGSYMSPSVARDIFNYMVKKTPKASTLNKASTSSIDLLSGRQKDVLEKVVEGLSYTQIGKVLFISPETVRTHIKNIYKVLHVNNKAGAIKKYLGGS